MRLSSIPAGTPFLDALARRWLAASGDHPLAVADGLILLPTRRAARSLAEAFLRVSGGRPLLLPRIVAFGALDEAPLALAGALSLLPAVDPARRLAELTRLILAKGGAEGASIGADHAWRLAVALAGLMDEAERADVDLAARLPDAVEAEYAAHWQATLDFLRIVTRAWPDWLAANGLANPAARQAALLRAQARAWQESPPAHRVWLAGSTGAVPAVAALTGVVARLPRGLVVLPGVDFALDDDAWAALDDAHPQAGLARLLAALGATRADVLPWDDSVPNARAALLSRALLPAASLAAWQQPEPLETRGITRLAPADQQEEAAAIALILRDALEKPGARAALVTPDRALAARVAAELLRFGVVADDSAGEPLAEAPPAAFLRLLAEAVDQALAPVPLLALLKHPLAALGLAPAAARAAARMLERTALRGPRPPPGITRLHEAVARKGGDTAFVARIERCLEPLLRATASRVQPPAALFAALIESAELLAATDAQDGASRLWALEEGEALAAELGAVLAVLPRLPDQPPSCLPGLLDAVLEGAVVRSRRALRGREGAEHPRIFIWGNLEARLQSADVIVLGGLAEGVWPPATDPGPWLSRPMRARVGLPGAEEAVGQAAHDFVQAACAAPEVVLSCPRRRDGAPTVKARWLVRLEAMLRGAEQALATHPAAHWAALLDRPVRARPVERPRPAPPVSLRPRRLRVTEIEILLADPYAIYARHVLKLDPLDPVDQATEAADYGMIVHDGMRRFLNDVGASWPDDAAARLRTALHAALLERRPRDALRAWWVPRLERIADWIAETESGRRAGSAPADVKAELSGIFVLSGLPAGDFTLRARADRIERYADGGLVILDYKTGAPPAEGAVKDGRAPQLPLEAMMAEHGAFPGITGDVRSLIYWKLTGATPAGEQKILCDKKPIELRACIDGAHEGLRALIGQYDNPAQPYLSQPTGAESRGAEGYALLARVPEWSAGKQGAGE